MQSRIRTVSLLVSCVLLLVLMAGILRCQAVGADMSNRRADFWRVVRQGTPAYTSTPQQGHTVLIQNSGENWREIRNGLIARFSPWLLAAALMGMGLFYLLAGQDKLEKPRSGVKIKRYALGERILHWYTALLFVVMAFTGLNLLLGRMLLIPVFGHPVVSGFLQASKALHNYCGPLLLVGIFLEFLVWFRINIPEKRDLLWFKSMGGMIGSGPRPHTGKMNGGEKGWFWLVIFFGTAVGITGVLLDFPIWGQTRLIMQVSHVIHAVVAVLFMTASLGHIYMGTLGVEGVFEGIWTGSVDAVWAEQNHDLWYEEKMREKENERATALPQRK